MHFGKITFDVDERGEVGLLTRNIKIQASADAEQTFFGGHIMAMATSHMYVEGVELNRMGQNLTLARYPIHWHLVGDAKGQYIRNASIHDTYNRCVTVHGTNYVQRREQRDLQHRRSLLLPRRRHRARQRVRPQPGDPDQVPYVASPASRPTSPHPERPAMRTRIARPADRVASNPRMCCCPRTTRWRAYWITNPDNIYRDNVAAGSDENGFWMSLPEHPNGAFADTEISKATWPRNMSVREFKGNVAHSNYDAFMMDRNINANNTFGVTGNMHIAHENPADRSSKIVETVFEDLTAYKNRNGGFWGRGEMRTYRNIKSADNAIGYTQASGLGGGASLADPYTSRVLDSLFVGETENIGNPTTPEEKAYGRSLPKPMMPDFPIRGYEYYDLRHDVVNTTFRNFEDNATRKTGALSYLLYTSFGVSSNNTIDHVKFVNAKPVYFPPMQGNARWANDNGNSQAYKTAAMRDKDGSLGAGPNAYVLINDGVNDSIATDTKACQIKPTWNAAVCKGDVGRLAFAAPPRFGGPGPAQRPRCSVVPVPVVPQWPGPVLLPQEPVVLAHLLVRVPGAGRASCSRWLRCSACPAASRSQPQWQGLPDHRRGLQCASRYRNQGDHRKADPAAQVIGAGQRLLGDLPAAGLQHRRLGHAADQPGCAAQGQRDLVLQGQGCTLGQGRLP